MNIKSYLVAFGVMKNLATWNGKCMSNAKWSPLTVSAGWGMGRAKAALAIEVRVTELLLETRQRCPSSRLQKAHSILQNKAPRQKFAFLHSGTVWGFGFVCSDCVLVCFRSSYCATVLSVDVYGIDNRHLQCRKKKLRFVFFFFNFQLHNGFALWFC